MWCKSFVALTALLMASSPCLAFSVFFLNPGRSNENYWTSAAQGMQMAAKSLEITLEVRYAERSPERMLEIVKEVAAGKKPDYLVIVNEYGVGGEMLRIADAAGIKT